MPKHFALTFLIALSATAALPGAPPAPLADAHEAWDRGDYHSALKAYLDIVSGPQGDAAFEEIALQTGELYRTRELTTDGRAPRFSPDGRLIAYETGLEVSRATRIVPAAGGAAIDLPGVSASFSFDSRSVAYLRLGDVAELTAAVRALDEAPLAGQSRGALIQALNFQVQRNATITVRNLGTGDERPLAAPGLLKTALAFAADNRTVYFLGADENDPLKNEIYSVTEGRAPTPVSKADGLKGAPTVDPSGAVLLYTVPTVNLLRRPTPPGETPRGGFAGGPNTNPRFGVVDLSNGATRMRDGSAPTLSADGRTIAYIVSRSGGESNVMVGGPLADAIAAVTTTGRVDAAALSPDGSRIAYQKMTRDDWEVHVINRDGTADRRMTNDVQHDVAPRFVGANRLLTAIGEPRHRRSFLYDLATGTRVRLFHNNTVRTIAPEYQWSVSPAGDQILIGAERDGDTVSPERGIYRVDLREKISKADLLARLRNSLAAETRLRDAGARTFAPIAADVRRIVGQVSTSRIFGYEKALFDFDSKHITRPGNKLASEYLFSTYKSFGYEPQMQAFDVANALGGKTANVLATLRGTENPELVYVVSSHYDSVAGGPGADDDTSGTAALLDAARVLAGHPMPATIVFASFTGEEAGLLGSREYVRQAVANKVRIVGALNNDMIGWANDQHLDNTIRYSNPGIRDIQHAAAFLFTRLITYDALYFKSTDAAAYYDAYGDIVGGIGSYPVLSSPHYHQSHDLLEFENHELIAETSKTTAATLMLLASSPSRIKDLKVERAAQAVALSWTASPEKSVTSYVVATGPAGGPLTEKTTVKEPGASLSGLAAGSVVGVKAVNARGLEGWDWARARVP